MTAPKKTVTFRGLAQAILAVVAVSLIAALVFVSLSFAILFLAPLDNLVGVVTGTALKRVQTFRQDGRAVEQVVRQSYPLGRWRAFHREYLNETYVRYEPAASERSPSLIMQWIVITRPNWRHPLSPEVVIVTAQNEAALRVAPSLYVPGQPIYKSADIANW